MKKFKEFINERYEISNLPSNIVLLTKSSGLHFLLYNKDSKSPVGYISISDNKSIGCYEVGGCFSENGFGAFLYETVMTKAFPSGVCMSRGGSTSDDALDVWRKFYKRDDVKKERIVSDEITHKMEDLPSGGFYSDDELSEILNLESMSFIYTYGKSRLNRLINIGIDYMDKNNIGDNEIEWMSWDLE